MNTESFSRGNINAPIMIVAECPGKEELEFSVSGTDMPKIAQDGSKTYPEYNVPMSMPLCGPAGRLLIRMLQWVGLKERDIIITNAVKNVTIDSNGEILTPTQNEVLDAKNDLHKEICKVNPNLIISVGKIALWSLCYSNSSLSDLRITKKVGIIHEFTAKERGYPYIQIPVYPIIHPAAVLRDEEDTKGYKTIFSEGFTNAKEFILSARKSVPEYSTINTDDAQSDSSNK